MAPGLHWQDRGRRPWLIIYPPALALGPRRAKSRGSVARRPRCSWQLASSQQGEGRSRPVTVTRIRVAQASPYGPERNQPSRMGVNAVGREQQRGKDIHTFMSWGVGGPLAGPSLPCPIYIIGCRESRATLATVRHHHFDSGQTVVREKVRRRV
jgi:hypothetical protein